MQGDRKSEVVPQGLGKDNTAYFVDYEARVCIPPFQAFHWAKYCVKGSGRLKRESPGPRR